KKPPEEHRSLRIGRTRRVRPAHPRSRQRPLQSVGREVVQLEILFGAPLPVPDIGFIPDFPIPRLSLLLSVAFRQMTRELVDQFTPAVIILGRISPAGPQGARWAGVAIRSRPSTECFGHETDFDQRPDADAPVSVKNAIQNGPLVYGLSGWALRVYVGGSPFKAGRPIPACEKVVRADGDRAGSQTGELAQQLQAVRCVSVVRLIVAKEAPDGAGGSLTSVGVDSNRDGLFGCPEREDLIRKSEQKSEEG